MIDKRSLALAALTLVWANTSFAVDGYSFGAAYTGEYWSNERGGLDQDHAYVDIFDLTLEIDAEQAWGLEGGTFYSYVFYTNSATLSEPVVGDVQGVSNIDNSHVIRIMELWYEQSLSVDHSVKVGLWDLNSEFDAIDSASFFINSSHGIGADFSQSGDNGPSIFPVSSLSLRFANQVNEQFSYQLAIVDAVSGDPDHDDRNSIQVRSNEGALLAFEVNYQTDKQRFGLGSWYYTQASDHIDGTAEDNNSGIYGFVDHTFLATEIDGQNLSAWLRYGIANDAVNHLDSYLGAGVLYSGFFTSRPDDSIGFAIARVSNGDDYRAQQALAGELSDHYETNFELSYRMPINDFLTLQPDIQYIMNPGTNPSLDNALVIGLRFELSLY